MSPNPHNTGNYVVKTGETVFYEGRKVQSLNLLLQGKLNIFISGSAGMAAGDDPFKKSYRIFDIDQNIFMGANESLLNGVHAFSCKAGMDSNLFGYDVKTGEQLMNLMGSQKDYGTYVINSLCSLIINSYNSYKKIALLNHSLKTISENLIIFFWALKEKYSFEYSPTSGFLAEGLDDFKELKQNGTVIPLVFSRQFMEKDFKDVDYSLEDDDRIDYYTHMYLLPSDIRKSFFGADMSIAGYHARDASRCLEDLLDNIRKAFGEAEQYFLRIFHEDAESLFSAYIKATVEIGAAGYDNTQALNTLDYIVSKIREVLAVYETEYSHPCQTDLAYLECSLNNIKAGLSPSSGAVEADQAGIKAGAGLESIPEELRDSTRKIIEFAEIPEERSDMLLMNLAAFRNLKDKLSTDEAARNIRNEVATVYFEIYEAVFKKACCQEKTPRLINMFLNYGYMDEKLLTPEQVMLLYRFAGKGPASGFESFYSMKEWLSAIYAMKKDPSINEFGQDYFDVFREMKKYGQASDKDKHSYESNQDGRLSYEISNMFKTNHKLCQGQITTYFPILNRDMITRDLQKALLTKEALKESLGRILDIDYSAFYREVHYRDADKGIEKEIIMKSVMPDIILVPVFGSRAMMWQEISGRNRSTAGRFIIPVFTDENLDEIMIKLVGNFRWELCRTMMGSAWNDVTQSSLTSEYTDYVQFYRKNSSLSEEAKDRLKSQIQKYHNKTKDIFTADYELWLNNEAKGNLRLNKVVRSILFKHCPFSKPIREQLEKQPVFTELSVPFRNQRAKLARELENRYSKYFKNGSPDIDLEQNLIFYRDL